MFLSNCCVVGSLILCWHQAARGRAVIRSRRVVIITWSPVLSSHSTINRTDSSYIIMEQLPLLGQIVIHVLFCILLASFTNSHHRQGPRSLQGITKFVSLKVFLKKKKKCASNTALSCVSLKKNLKLLLCKEENYTESTPSFINFSTEFTILLYFVFLFFFFWTFMYSRPCPGSIPNSLSLPNIPLIYRRKTKLPR